MFTPDKVTIDDLIAYLGANGYLVKASEMQFAVDNDALKYVGYHFTQRHHQYLIGCEEDDNYFVTVIFVYLGQNGDLVAEYGQPLFESDDEQQVLDYIENKCNL